MVTCTRCCVHKSMRIVNFVINFCGIAMIIYSLWLLKKWQQGVAELPSISDLPQPWFIYTCLGMGIAVCLSTLFGHMVANCISNATLCIYVVSICSLLFLEIGVIITIFFRMNWGAEIAKYIDEHHIKFKSFVIFHLLISRLIVLLILIPQINVIVLAIILWAIGTVPRNQSNNLEILNVTQSFLVLPESATRDGGSAQICSRCEALCTRNSSFFSTFKSAFRIQFQRRITLT